MLMLDFLSGGFPQKAGKREGVLTSNPGRVSNTTSSSGQPAGIKQGYQFIYVSMTISGKGIHGSILNAFNAWT
jgi:hypothetical protein